MTRLKVKWHSSIHQGLKTFSSYLAPRYICSNLISLLMQLVSNCWFVFVQMRALAKNGENPADGFMCRGGWEVLVEYYESLAPAANNGRLPQPVAA